MGNQENEAKKQNVHNLSSYHEMKGISSIILLDMAYIKIINFGTETTNNNKKKNK